MNQPGLYLENNDVQQRDTMYVLKKYFHLIQWKATGKENVLDVGCGDGTVTANLLFPLLPENVQRLIGIDKSFEMVEFAKAQLNHRKVSFMQLDISTRQLNADLKEEFHHIFSFYCLHWVQDQRQCAFNLYSMLKPGGDVFLTFLATHPFYQVYENLSKLRIWAEYMKNINKYICPYHYSKDPAKEFKNTLRQVGFVVNLCKVISKSYTFKDMFFWKFSTEAINPFLGRMSNDLKSKFMDDMLSELKKLNCTVLNNSNQETVHIRYELFIVYAHKPL